MCQRGASFIPLSLARLGKLTPTNCPLQLTLQAIKATKDAMFFGIKESQTSSLLSRYFEELGMPGGEGLVLFGGEYSYEKWVENTGLIGLDTFSENAALPHGSGTDRALEEGDFALIDAGGQFRGYTSDITRVSALQSTFHY